MWRKEYSQPATEESIKQAEELIGRQFPEEYRDFLHTFGTLTFGSTEIKGIWQNQPEIEEEDSVAGIYLEYIQDELMPGYLVPIYSLSDGEEYCLNYNQLNRDGILK